MVAAAASASINFTREVYHEEKTSVIPLLAAAAAAATARHREICMPQAPVFNAPYSVEISQKKWENRMIGLPFAEESLMIC